MEKSVKYWKFFENTGKHPSCQTCDPQPRSVSETWNLVQQVVQLDDLCH